MIITIDGPTATGKSSIAKKVAERLNFTHFDTGAMYRCLTYAMVEKGLPSVESPALDELLESFDFSIKTNGDQKSYLVNGVDVTEAIRRHEISNLTSPISALPSVRKRLVYIQRDQALHGDTVFEGRDMGTVIFPEADLKIFLTATPEVRAQRRLDELREKFPEEAKNQSLEQVLADLHERDLRDTTRKISPLKQAEDAYVIDTSYLTIDQVIDEILHLKEQHCQ